MLASRLISCCARSLLRLLGLRSVTLLAIMDIRLLRRGLVLLNMTFLATGSGG